MAEIRFTLPLYPGRHVFSDRALDDMARLYGTGDVPVVLGAGGERIGTVLSAERDGDTVVGTVQVDDAAAQVIGGFGLDVEVPSIRESPSSVPWIGSASSLIARPPEQLDDGARPRED